VPITNKAPAKSAGALLSVGQNPLWERLSCHDCLLPSDLPSIKHSTHQRPTRLLHFSVLERSDRVWIHNEPPPRFVYPSIVTHVHHDYYPIVVRPLDVNAECSDRLPGITDISLWLCWHEVRLNPGCAPVNALLAHGPPTCPRVVTSVAGASPAPPLGGSSLPLGAPTKSLRAPSATTQRGRTCTLGGLPMKNGG